MTREEFLHRLRAALYLSVSDQIINEQVSYYNKYINEEISMGRTEEEVVESLGDPRLLAKSIIDAAEAGGDEVANETPFRYSEEQINYSSDEEDKQYGGTASDSGKSEDTVHPQTEYTDDTEDGGTAGSTADRQQSGGRRSHQDPFGHMYTMSSAGCLVTMLIFFVVLYLIVTIVGGVFSFLSPVLIPLMVVGVILWIIKGIMDK